MENNRDEKNKSQIIRKDARNCFVESKSDAFEIGKTHLEFATYDTSRPAGQRQTNYVSIYIDMAEFYGLAQEAQCGNLHNRMLQFKQIIREIEKYKAENNGQLSGDMRKKQDYVSKPLYQSLGGTSAEKLKVYGRSRTDGKSLSRSVKLFVGSKADYLFCAESGPGEADAKGLIVPRYGGKPEQRVSVSLSYMHFNEILLMTKVHYEAWLAAQYLKYLNNGKSTSNESSTFGGSDPAVNGMNMFP